MKHVRWGILGASNFAKAFMAPALHSAPGGELASVATNREQAAAEFESLYKDIIIHQRYEALLNDPEIDAVYIPLPNTLHIPWALKALDCGKHVLVEKPVSMNVTELDQLIAVRDSSGLIASEAYMIYYHPQWAQLKKLLKNNHIGKLNRIEGHFCFPLPTLRKNIRNNPELGGGAMRDIGVYPIGAAHYATELNLEDVVAQIEMADGIDRAVELTGWLGDIRFSAWVSFDCERDQGMVFRGEEGMISLPAPFNMGSFNIPELIIRHKSNEERKRYPRHDQYVLQVEAFNQAVLQKEASLVVPLEFSRQTQRVIDEVLGES